VPLPRDSVIASQVAQNMLDFATTNSAPCVGTEEQMQRILAHREQLRRDASNPHPSVLI
jgi:hypothetical protein